MCQSRPSARSNVRRSPAPAHDRASRRRVQRLVRQSFGRSSHVLWSDSGQAEHDLLMPTKAKSFADFSDDVCLSVSSSARFVEPARFHLACIARRVDVIGVLTDVDAGQAAGRAGALKKPEAIDVTVTHGHEDDGRGTCPIHPAVVPVVSGRDDLAVSDLKRPLKALVSRCRDHPLANPEQLDQLVMGNSRLLAAGAKQQCRSRQRDDSQQYPIHSFDLPNVQ